LSTPQPGAACVNCRRGGDDAKLDTGGWCAACRAETVRRAELPARLATGVAGLLIVWLLFHFGALTSRFVVLWIALGVLIGFGAYKVARRVAFDLIRDKGVTPRN
jgi:uncharacterized membrane protein